MKCYYNKERKILAVIEDCPEKQLTRKFLLKCLKYQAEIIY